MNFEIVHGADAINYYRWRQNWFGTEQLTIGVLNWDSYAGERYEVVSQLGKELPTITNLLQGIATWIKGSVSPECIGRSVSSSRHYPNKCCDER